MAPTKVADGLYVADIDDVRTRSLSDLGIDVVVGVCQDNVEDNVGVEYHYFCLSDGEPQGRVPGEYSYELFEDAVDVVRDARRDGDTVCVHCHAGQSRSVSVAACALACDDDYTFDEAFWHLRTTRETNVSPDIKLLASQYVNRH